MAPSSPKNQDFTTAPGEMKDGGKQDAADPFFKVTQLTTGPQQEQP